MKCINQLRFSLIVVLLSALFSSCQKDANNNQATGDPQSYPAIRAAFPNSIDPDQLFNYAGQAVPNYIVKDNSGANVITNAGATLGRVLFYDANLSSDNSVSCGSCHQQQYGFSDLNLLSDGVNGQTNRHAMRLINSRFSAERRFFWDERANNLEEQTTMPIQDHLEMGFSGTNGDGNINDLIVKLGAIDYYQELFQLAFGSPDVTEQKMQVALSQFIRSIQSFDSKYDEGRAQVTDDAPPFPNFTAAENNGKQLFLAPPNAGGAGCAGCHRPPEFDIDPNSLNNNIVGDPKNAGSMDITITRAPSLRDLEGPNGVNGPLMHDASLTSLRAVVDHYNQITPVNGNTNLDPRLRGPNNQGQNLQLNETQKNNLVSFLQTLSGSDVYTNPMYSDPF